VPKSTEPTFDQKLMEAMTHGLAENDGAHVPDGADQVLELCERAGALVLGPGIGRTDGALQWAREVARRAPCPVLIDADGLNAHAGKLESLRERQAPTVLTPHEGELGRLLDIDSDEVQAHRLTCAAKAAERSGCVVVLKGDDTIVAMPDRSAAVSRGATPALATAGTGDVLSGLAGTLLAKGMEPFAAAAAGVLAHARAGRVAADRLGADHVIAGDVIDAIPEAMAR
jgi:NAD(P)H-hydrate epimerase